MENDILVDILCPLYNAEMYIPKIIEGINSQKNIKVNSMIFPVTQSSDNTLELAKKIDNAIVVEISKAQFSHSLTREEMVFKYSNAPIVIFMTQDVILSDENALYELANSINCDIIHAFSRQITKSKGIEKYTREINYPKDSYSVSIKDVEKMQIKAFYSSDACAAYNRIKFVELGGFDHKIFQVSEDMYFCRKAILNGYSIKYCAESVVTHSHTLTLKQVYKRYYDIGLFFGQNPEFAQYKSLNSGFGLAWNIFKKALKHFDIPVLFRLIPDMTARYLGKKKGEKYARKKCYSIK